LENSAWLLPSGAHADGDTAGACGRDVAAVTEDSHGGMSKRGGVAEPASV
jgi:hypothetical protein